ncbi:MAG: 1-deoxy-D-xylulose-5-phosphate synthase N-terminal domain-containing protein, partial [Actinomycetota bacterium]|nr:1-deoxy-D-xylulose-5-phosphate synthase N-terminal domain-containing protein [Actinomycetota bacterium]
MRSTPLLDSLSGPSDLKGLDYRELEILAEEIRSVIVETAARCGGHLAPSLGVVELTIALHTVFDSPRDKIIW